MGLFPRGRVLGQSCLLRVSLLRVLLLFVAVLLLCVLVLLLCFVLLLWSPPCTVYSDLFCMCARWVPVSCRYLSILSGS